MTTYRYRLIPEAQVPARTRTLAREALTQAATFEGIGEPRMYWFLLADQPHHQVFNESERYLAGWTVRHEIYIAADLPNAELVETIAHECAHIYIGTSGYGTKRGNRKATEREVDQAHEQNIFYACRLVRKYFRKAAPSTIPKPMRSESNGPQNAVSLVLV